MTVPSRRVVFLHEDSRNPYQISALKDDERGKVWEFVCPASSTSAPNSASKELDPSSPPRAPPPAPPSYSPDCLFTMVVSNEGWIGFRSAFAENLYLQAARTNPRLRLSSPHFGVREQWTVSPPLPDWVWEDHHSALASELCIQLQNRHLSGATFRAWIVLLPTETPLPSVTIGAIVPTAPSSSPVPAPPPLPSASPLSASVQSNSIHQPLSTPPPSSVPRLIPDPSPARPTAAAATISAKNSPGLTAASAVRPMNPLLRSSDSQFLIAAAQQVLSTPLSASVPRSAPAVPPSPAVQEGLGRSPELSTPGGRGAGAPTEGGRRRGEDQDPPSTSASRRLLPDFSRTDPLPSSAPTPSRAPPTLSDSRKDLDESDSALDTSAMIASFADRSVTAASAIRNLTRHQLMRTPWSPVESPLVSQSAFILGTTPEIARPTKPPPTPGENDLPSTPSFASRLNNAAAPSPVPPAPNTGATATFSSISFGALEKSVLSGLKSFQEPGGGLSPTPDLILGTVDPGGTRSPGLTLRPPPPPASTDVAATLLAPPPPLSTTEDRERLESTSLANILQGMEERLHSALRAAIAGGGGHSLGGKFNHPDPALKQAHVLGVISQFMVDLFAVLHQREISTLRRIQGEVQGTRAAFQAAHDQWRARLRSIQTETAADVRNILKAMVQRQLQGFLVRRRKHAQSQVLSAWCSSVQVLREARARAEDLCALKRERVTALCFEAWRYMADLTKHRASLSSTLKTALERHSSRLLASCFATWRAAVKRAQLHQREVDLYLQRKQKKVLSKVWQGWNWYRLRHKALRSRLASRITLVSCRLLRACFTAWRGQALQAKALKVREEADRHYSARVTLERSFLAENASLSSAYAALQDRCAALLERRIERELQRAALREWHSVAVQEKRERQGTERERALWRAFFGWRQLTSFAAVTGLSSSDLDQDEDFTSRESGRPGTSGRQPVGRLRTVWHVEDARRVRTLRTCLLAWSSLTEKSRTLTLLEGRLETKWALRQKRRCLRHWREHTAKKKGRNRIVAVLLRRRSFALQRKCFAAWSAFVQQTTVRQADFARSVRVGTLRRFFRSWRTAVRHQKALAALPAESKLQLQKVMLQWRQGAAFLAALRAKFHVALEGVRDAALRSLLASTFVAWRHLSRKKRKLMGLEERLVRRKGLTVLTRSFLAWRTISADSTRRARAILKIGRRYRTATLRHYFLEWRRVAWDESRARVQREAGEIERKWARQQMALDEISERVRHPLTAPSTADGAAGRKAVAEKPMQGKQSQQRQRGERDRARPAEGAKAVSENAREENSSSPAAAPLHPLLSSLLFRDPSGAAPPPPAAPAVEELSFLSQVSSHDRTSEWVESLPPPTPPSPKVSPSPIRPTPSTSAPTAAPAPGTKTGTAPTVGGDSRGAGAASARAQPRGSGRSKSPAPRIGASTSIRPSAAFLSAPRHLTSSTTTAPIRLSATANAASAGPLKKKDKGKELDKATPLTSSRPKSAVGTQTTPATTTPPLKLGKPRTKKAAALNPVSPPAPSQVLESPASSSPEGGTIERLVSLHEKDIRVANPLRYELSVAALRDVQRLLEDGGRGSRGGISNASGHLSSSNPGPGVVGVPPPGVTGAGGGGGGVRYRVYNNAAFESSPAGGATAAGHGGAGPFQAAVAGQSQSPLMKVTVPRTVSDMDRAYKQLLRECAQLEDELEPIALERVLDRSRRM